VRAGCAYQLVAELAGRLGGVIVEVGHAQLQTPIGAADFLDAAESRLCAHDLLVQLLVVRVPADRLLEHVEGTLMVAGLLVEVGEAAGGGDCLAAEVLAFGESPVVVGAVNQVALVGGQCLLESGSLGGRVAGVRGGGDGVLEAPQVAADQVGVCLVAVDDPRDRGGVVGFGEAEGAAQVAQDRLEPGDAAVGVQLWPECLDGGVAGDAAGVDQQVGEQLDGFGAKAFAELAAVDVDLERAEQLDLDRAAGGWVGGPVARLDRRPRTRDRISARGTLVNTRPPQGLCTPLENPGTLRVWRVICSTSLAETDNRPLCFSRRRCGGSVATSGIATRLPPAISL
jgi:hypothetical protein